MKTAAKPSVRPAKKIKLYPATASEILESLNVSPLEKRRAKAALAAVMRRRSKASSKATSGTK